MSCTNALSKKIPVFIIVVYSTTASVAAPCLAPPQGLLLLLDEARPLLAVKL